MRCIAVEEHQVLRLRGCFASRSIRSAQDDKLFKGLPRARDLIPRSPQSAQACQGSHVSLIQRVRLRVALFRLLPIPLVLVDASEIEVWIAAGFVTRGRHCFLEPWDGLIPFFLLNQVRPDIVVRVAEFGIDLDGLKAFGNGAVVVSKKE